MILSPETIQSMLEDWINLGRYNSDQLSLVSWSPLRNKRLKLVFEPKSAPVKK